MDFVMHQAMFFFLEHAGELHIIVLVEEKEPYIDPNTHTPLHTFPVFTPSNVSIC
jgi:hypothetical protein